MNVFVVQLKSVYHHGVVGIFETESEAMKAITEIHKCSDGFHSYKIIEYELGKADELTKLKDDDRCLSERTPHIYETKIEDECVEGSVAISIADHNFVNILVGSIPEWMEEHGKTTVQDGSDHEAGMTIPTYIHGGHL